MRAVVTRARGEGAGGTAAGRRRRLAARLAMLAGVAVLVLLSTAAPALALEPPRPGELARLQRQGLLKAREARARRLGNQKVSPALVWRTRLELQRARLGLSASGPLGTVPPAMQGMPTTGTVKVLALLISFSDYAPSVTKSTYQSSLFGAGNPANAPYESLHGYYSRSSYDQLDIEGDVLGWYDTGQPRSSVPQTDAGRQALIEQALDYYDAQGYDFSQYDNDGDGTIDYLIVVWTGPDNGWGNFWWGYQTTFNDPSYSIDGKGLGTYSWQWQSSSPLVPIHETGHALGLPDYYDYDPSEGPDGGVGGLDMMDHNWGDHNAFSKFLLGWITPQTLGEGNGAFMLGPSATQPDALIVMPGADAADPFSEYFIVQDRYRTGNDADIPGDGLLIWHVDARLDAWDWNFLYDNSYTDHKLLRLMEADGKESIERGDGADAGDFYVPGESFGPSTTPNSSRYDGTSTKVTVGDLAWVGQSLSLAAGAGDSNDTTAPTTTVLGADTAWHDTPVTLTFTAEDDAGGSGVDHTEYRVDGGSWQTGGEVTVPAPAGTRHVYVVGYRSADKAGNLEAEKTCTVRIDTLPACDDDIPGVSLPVSPVVGQLAVGSDVHDVFAVALGAGETLRAVLTAATGTDFDLYLFSPAGTGVADGQEVVASAATLSYPDTLYYRASAAGTYYLDVRAYQGAGEYQLTWQVAAAGVDIIPPVTTVSGVPDGWVNAVAVELTFSATDSGGSGFDHTEYMLNDSGVWQPGGSTTISAEGLTRVDMRSVDRAANWEEPSTVHVAIDRHGPETYTTVPRSVRYGRVATVRYHVTDISDRVYVQMTIVSAARPTRVAKKLTLGWKTPGKTYSCRVRCSFARGRYRVRLDRSTHDAAGNLWAQAHTNRRLRVH